MKYERNREQLKIKLIKGLENKEQTQEWQISRIIKSVFYVSK